MKIDELRIRRTREVDMSPSAIARRLARLEQLFRRGLSLSRARRIDSVRGSDRQRREPEDDNQHREVTGRADER